MRPFHYRDGTLHAEGVPLTAIAAAAGTPVYVYAQGAIVAAYRELAEAFAGLDARICYAVKANGNLAVIRTLAALGAGADVVSGGELARALAAGIAPGAIVFSGVGKTRAEIAAALEAGIAQINVESEPELRVVSEVAQACGRIAPVALRVNPDVAAATHAKIATGTHAHKFGIPAEAALGLYRVGSGLPSVRMAGLAVHIGSQLMDLAPFAAAFRILAELTRAVRAEGLAVERLDLGGGLGIAYLGEEPPTASAYAGMVRETVGPLGCALVVEPGRRLVGNAGVLLTRVLYVKETPAQRFVIVDAGMNDLLRPTLYEAHHGVLTVSQTGPGTALRRAEVAGPVCETGDVLARDAALPELAEGDLLAIEGAGAYGAVMASYYNGRPLVGETLVSGERFAVVRPRHEPSAIQALDRIPDWLDTGRSARKGSGA